MERELSKAKAHALAVENEAALAETWHQQILKQRESEPICPDPVQQPPNCQPLSESEEKPDIRKIFRPVESLKLEFQYLLPDSLILQAGKGFLRNAQNELIPEADTFQGMNSAAGYAMVGLFYLYNAVYHGEEYTFQQIMAGEMGNSYVCIRSVIETAKIAKAGESEYYSLTAKGKLHVVDVQ